MKTCPFCAEEIQDAAIVCKHCGRDLVPGVSTPPTQAQPVAASRSRVLLPALVALGSVLAVVAYVAVSRDRASRPVAETPLLQITAGRDALGASVTNRENVPIFDCDVTVLDRGDDEWTAAVSSPIAPGATASVPWSDFSAKGQTMPSDVGPNRKYYTVSCTVGSERRSAGLAFE